MKHIHKLMYLALPLLLTSCIKDGFDKENCPGSLIIIPTIPGEEGGGTELKDTYTKVIDANGKEHIVDVGSGKPIDLDDGTYTIVSAKGLKDDQANIKGTTISVVTNPDGTAGDPGTPSGGYTDITIGGNNPGGGQDEVKLEVPVVPQSRPLILKIHFEGENTALIQSLAGTVSGIALSRDLNYGFTPIDGQDRHPAITTGSINYNFSPGTETKDTYESARTLLGICGKSTQDFSLTVNYEGDVQQPYTFDLTSQLDGFHTKDVTSSWVIEITLRLGADFQATIEDWKAGPESWMDAH